MSASFKFIGVKTNIKAGGFRMNRCETISPREIALVVNTNVKAGGMFGIRVNRCESVQRKQIALIVKTNVKAGGMFGIRLNRCESVQARKSTRCQIKGEGGLNLRAIGVA